MSTLVLCPSRGRPEGAEGTLDSFEATRRDPGSRIVFIVERDDPTHLRYPPEHTLVLDPQGSMGAAVTAATRDRALMGDATSVGMVGDDCRFRTPGWDLTIDGWLTEHIGVAWPDDGWAHAWSSEEKAAHWWLSRPIVDVMGMCHREQRHFYMDDYWAQLGQAAGVARYFPDVLVEHLHPLAGKAEMDDTYRRAHRFVAGDKAWWSRWQRRGKDQDLRRLQAILRASRPLRVFADWHHPSLWESLSIVLEDRFGWQLSSPLGEEWTSHGWTVHDATPGWTVRDYLVHPATLVGDHHELVEPEYPRPRKLVTWDQFAATDWDIVIASLGRHQRSFADLAHQRGAKFVHHVGDAKRQIEDRRATVIASAVVPRAVTHHQEFDTTLFAFAPPPDDRAVVSSFMLRLDSTSGPYAWLAEADGVEWWAVQCDAMRGPGYVAPMTKVAEQLRRTGWVWHDKRIGDGYGHVLFTAAAVGRPIIGHASHYKGLLGEDLWDDLVTCIDLDRWEPERALRLVRTISADADWYAEMSAAIRARFDALVDFDAEAARIKAALV